MRKIDLVNELAKKYKYLINKEETKEIVDSLFDMISESLVEGEEVDIFQFGKFEVKERAEREGFNPMTKEKRIIPSTKTIKFKASKSLKRIVNDGIDK